MYIDSEGSASSADDPQPRDMPVQEDSEGSTPRVMTKEGLSCTCTEYSFNV